LKHLTDLPHEERVLAMDFAERIRDSGEFFRRHWQLEFEHDVA
jgi:hypothetical protein